MGRENWELTTLGKVADYINGRAFKPSEWENVGLPIIRIQNLTKSSDVVNYTTGKFENKYLIEEDDLLMAWSATLDVFIWKEGQAWLNQHIFKVIENKEFISKRFLYYLLKQAIGDLYLKTHGSGMVHITKPKFISHPILLPPLEEQNRIVEKLDSILPRIQAAKARLEKIPQLLKRFRQSVLTDACSGKLTEGWRETEFDNQNNNLLNSNSNTEKLDLPSTWQYMALGNIIDELAYGTSQVCEKNQITGTPVLRIPNISSGKLQLSDLKYAILDPKESNKLKLKIDDILIIRSNGSVSLLGKSILITKEADGMCFAGYLIRLRIKTELASPKYIDLCLKSEKIRGQIELPARSTTGVHNINSTEIRNLIISLPPVQEQIEIVNQINRLFAIADSLEMKYKFTMQRIEKLEQAVLAKAFRGELLGS